MATEIETDEEDQPVGTRVARKPREERPLRTDEKGNIEVGAEQPERPGRRAGPEDAIADSADAVQARDRELEAERARSDKAERENAELRKNLGGAHAARVAERENGLAAAITAQTSRKAASAAAVRAARDNGDVDAELTAQADFSDAATKLSMLDIEKTQFENWKKTQPTGDAAGDRAQPHRPDAKSAQWLREHPRFNVDAEYKAAAITAHDAAVSVYGYALGSDDYINFIEQNLSELYGDDHGKITRRGAPAEDDPPKKNGKTAPRKTDAAAPRSSDAGGLTVSSRAAEFTQTFENGKSLTASFDPRSDKVTLNGVIPALWVEMAKVNRMTPIEYAEEQFRIMRDDKGGRETGLRMGDEGARFS